MKGRLPVQYKGVVVLKFAQCSAPDNVKGLHFVEQGPHSTNPGYPLVRNGTLKQRSTKRELALQESLWRIETAEGGAGRWLAFRLRHQPTVHIK